MHPAHRHHHDLSDPCSCKNCVKIPLENVFSNGSSIDRLYYNKQIPPRERKLLEKLVRTRAVYDDIRCRILSSNSSIDVKDYNINNNRRKDIRAKDAIEINPIHRLVDLVDRGELPQFYSPVNFHSECCTCCLCGSKISAISTQSKIHIHIPSLENVNKYLTHHGVKIKKALRHTPIRSDLCICPSKVSTKQSMSIEEQREVEPIEGIQESNKIKHQPANKRNKVKCLCPSRIIGTAFRVKKDSITLFKEKLLRKSQAMKYDYAQWHSNVTKSKNKSFSNSGSLKQKLLRVICKCKKQTKSTVSMTDVSFTKPTRRLFSTSSMAKHTDHHSLPLAKEYTSKVLLKRSSAAHQMARCFCTLQPERTRRRQHLHRYISKLRIPSSTTGVTVTPHSIGITKKSTKTKNVKCLCDTKDTVSTSTQSLRTTNASVSRRQPHPYTQVSPTFERHKLISLSASKATSNKIKVPKHRKRMLRPTFDEAPYAVKSKSFPYGAIRQYGRSNSSINYDTFFKNYPEATVETRRKPKYNESIEYGLESSNNNRHSMTTVVNYVMPPQSVPKKLLPYECEPNFCNPDRCDPHVCEKRIKSRKMPKRLIAITKCLCNPRRHKKHLKPERKKSLSLPNSEYYEKPYAEEIERPIAPHRQVVKLSSNFRIELEISRPTGQSDRPSIKNNYYRTDRKDGKLMKHYHLGHQKPHEHRPQMYNEWSQVSRSIDGLETSSRNTLNPLLKRCLCTLKLHKRQHEGNESKAKTKKNKKTSLESLAIVSPPITSLRSGLLPYECEPNFCAPGECNPRICDKRIRQRNEATKYRDHGIDNKKRPMLKRCLCTLKFHIAGAATGGKKSNTAIPLNKKTKKTGTVLTRKCLPYECEPGVCFPGQCDPYECLKLIDRRNMRNVKYRTKDVNTIRPNKRSVYIPSRRSVNQESQSSMVQYRVKRKKKEDKTDNKKKCECECEPNISRRTTNLIRSPTLIHPRLNQSPSYSSALHPEEPQVAVKLSSQLSISIEFSRNKPLTNEDVYEDKYALFKEAERNRHKSYQRYYNENKQPKYPTGTKRNKNSYKSVDDNIVKNVIKHRSTKPSGIHYVNKGMSTKGNNRTEISQRELKRAYKYDTYAKGNLERCFCTLDLMKMYDQENVSKRGRRL